MKFIPSNENLPDRQYAKRIYLMIRCASFTSIFSCNTFENVNKIHRINVFRYLSFQSGIFYLHNLVEEKRKPITIVEQRLMYANNNKQSVCKSVFFSFFYSINGSIPLLSETTLVCASAFCRKPCDGISHKTYKTKE